MNDELPWQLELADLAMSYLRKEVPVLGLCFGHQLMAKSFGGTVDYVYSDKDRLYGGRKVAITGDCPWLGIGDSFELAVNHRQEVKTIPADLVQLGTSDVCKYEALMHRSLPFFGFQGHPEASEHFIDSYIGNLTESKKRTVIGDGDRLIDAFLKWTLARRLRIERD